MDEMIELQVTDSDENSLTISNDDLLDGWDDDVTPTEESTESDVAPEVADQPTGETSQTEENPAVQSEAPKTEEPKAEEPQPDADQYLELKHFDEVRKVSKDEAKVLAQKGIDYDRIRGRLGEAENTIQKLQKYETFLKEIQGDFKSIDDLMTDTRARVMSDKDGISYEDAVKKVQEANQPKPQQAPQEDRSAVIRAMKQASYEEFARMYPDILPKDIPVEVWQDMEKTNDLVVSYEKYTTKQELASTKSELANIKAEIEAIKQNKINEEKAVGSLKTSGSAKTVDKYLEGWDDE